MKRLGLDERAVLRLIPNSDTKRINRVDILQSPSKPSSYDSTYGYDISESGQMLFEFTKSKRSAIYFV